jgi:hypothetical protein
VTLVESFEANVFATFSFIASRLDFVLNDLAHFEAQNLPEPYIPEC